MAGVIRPDHLTIIEKSKVLLVGAGGIGCEVLKCLVQSGFKDIEIVSFLYGPSAVHLLQNAVPLYYELFSSTRLIWTQST